MYNPANNTVINTTFKPSIATNLIPFVPHEPQLPALIPNEYTDVRFNDKFSSKFEMQNDGLYQVIGVKKEYISQPFKVLSAFSDIDGVSNGLQILFKKYDGAEIEFNFKKTDLISKNGNVIADLVDYGFKYDLSKLSNLRNALNSLETENIATITYKNGWVDENNSYFLSGKMLSGDTNHKVIWGGDIAEKYQQKGTLENWNYVVGNACKHSNAMALTVCAALSGAALKICKNDGFGFHFYGGSSNGKSLLIEAGASVYGKEVKSWNTTANGIEGAACAANDGIICLDELSEGTAKDVSKIAYMLANGKGKQRANINGDAKKIKTWKLVLLSSGEVTLEQKINEDNGQSKLKAGQLVRFIQIPVFDNNKMGIFKSVPERFKNTAEYADYLKKQIPEYQGVVIQELVKNLAIDKDIFVRDFYQKYASILEKKYEKSSNQVKRALKHFAITMAIGEYAVSKNILDFEQGFLAKACQKCLDDWIKTMPNTNYEVLEGVKTIKKFIEVNGQSAFSSDGIDDYMSSKKFGVRVDSKGSEDNLYCFFTTSFVGEVMKGINPKPSLDYLKKAGILITNKDRNDYKIPYQGKQVRTYAISDKILELDLDNL